ncbi:MAG: hypothetical protein NC388_09300 [Clostridium sp.]|nr:hypothetical protein [Clostridium sp.]
MPLTKVMMNETLTTGLRIPKGINIAESTKTVGPEIKKCAFANAVGLVEHTDPQSTWSYLFVHNRRVDIFARQLEAIGQPYFVHRTVVYRRRKESRGIQAIDKPTVSGLIFLQGSPRALQSMLNVHFSPYHLVNNCSTGRPAVIPDAQMQPFMRLIETDPGRIRFLLHPFKYYADGNTKLRITSGFLAGLEGYVIRIDRDRRLVMDVGGMGVAISGIHCETFEVVE